MAPSSSSGSEKKKKIKKDKKDKKDKKEKKDKKDKKPKKKDDEKERKRIERAESWNCERGDAVRQIGALLQLDAAVEEELDGVFEAIDEGETVRIDGLQNKQARKKLRHLLQAFRLTQEDNGQAYRSCELKVSFKSIYQECLGRAKEHFAAKPVETIDAEPEEEVVEAPDEPMDPRAGYSGEAEELPIEAPRIRGPQLPGATVGAVADDEEASESDAEAGPRGEGEEREGVDLRYVDPEKSGREEWMTMAPESMAGLFMDGNGMIRKKKADVFAVKRSKEEQEDFEKAFKERGPSLLSQQQQGAFSEAKDAQDSMRKRKVGTSDIWGMSEKDQDRQAAGAPTRRKSFDPEKDLVTTKPITSDAFAKLVENSQSGLTGRFSRGGVSSSFL